MTAIGGGQAGCCAASLRPRRRLPLRCPCTGRQAQVL